MGLKLTKLNRRLDLVVAVLALVGLEFDVLCNPYAPTLILHRLMSSHRDSHPTPATDLNQRDPSALTNAATGSAESCPDAENSEPNRGSITILHHTRDR